MRALLLVVIVSVAGAIAVIVISHRESEVPTPRAAVPAPPRKPVAPLTCEDVQAEHERTERATSEAYQRALTAKSLTMIALETREVGGFPSEEAVAKSIPAAVAPWQPFTYKVNGRARIAVANEIYWTDHWSRHTAEFVTDAAGDIWHVMRVPLVKATDRVSVQACAWGCWGQPPHGAIMREDFTRDLWLVPAGHTYRGDLEISYDAPALFITYIDLDCSAPA